MLEKKKKSSNTEDHTLQASKSASESTWLILASFSTNNWTSFMFPRYFWFDMLKTLISTVLRKHNIKEKRTWQAKPSGVKPWLLTRSTLAPFSNKNLITSKRSFSCQNHVRFDVRNKNQSSLNKRTQAAATQSGVWLALFAWSMLAPFSKRYSTTLKWPFWFKNCKISFHILF